MEAIGRDDYLNQRPKPDDVQNQNLPWTADWIWLLSSLSSYPKWLQVSVLHSKQCKHVDKPAPPPFPRRGRGAVMIIRGNADVECSTTLRALEGWERYK